MQHTKGTETARSRKSQKVLLSSDCRLQLACMKLESLVMAYQNDAVNTFPGLVHTARHAMEVVSARSRCRNPQGTKPPKASAMTGAKS